MQIQWVSPRQSQALKLPVKLPCIHWCVDVCGCLYTGVESYTVSQTMSEGEIVPYHMVRQFVLG